MNTNIFWMLQILHCMYILSVLMEGEGEIIKLET